MSLPQFDFSTWACLASAAILAVLIPVLFVFIRHEVRVQRLKVLVQFDRIFKVSKEHIGEDVAAGAQRTAADAAGDGPEPSSTASSFEYVREKYLEDIDPADFTEKGRRVAAGEAPMPVDMGDPMFIERIRKLKWYRLRSSWVLLWTSTPYMLLTAAGLVLLLACDGSDPLGQLLGGQCRPLIISAGLGQVTDAQAQAYFENVLVVAGMAFLGAYIFTLTTLARAVATFDLSAITMLRVTIHLITGVVGALVAFRGLPDLIASGQSLVAGATGGAPSAAAVAAAAGFGPLPHGWYIVAFALGLVPDLVINWVLALAQMINGSSSPPGEAFKRIKSVPLDVIDGIDFFTKFRLQNANIYEVQNLAVSNPIMMFVETPFGIYQCIDWVGQAQLCSVVGPERFVAMRRYNIRTIFDLERALLSKHTTSQMRRFVVALMMTTPPSAEDTARWKFWTLNRGQAAAGGGDVGSDSFGGYVAQLFAEPAVGSDGLPIAGNPDRTMKHLGRIVVDDLHVHRLRQLWDQIASRLGARYALLEDSEP